MFLTLHNFFLGNFHKHFIIFLKFSIFSLISSKSVHKFFENFTENHNSLVFCWAQYFQRACWKLYRFNSVSPSSEFPKFRFHLKKSLYLGMRELFLFFTINFQSFLLFKFFSLFTFHSQSCFRLQKVLLSPLLRSNVVLFL